MTRWQRYCKFCDHPGERQNWRGTAEARRGYSGLGIMKFKALLFIALVFAVAAPAYADARSEAKQYAGFGIELAQKQLWKAAATQFERAVELDETYAAGWNNLGIAYEQLGRFDDARKAYDKALSIEPDNQFILNNYDQFREIYDRQNRRRRG